MVILCSASEIHFRHIPPLAEIPATLKRKKRKIIFEMRNAHTNATEALEGLISELQVGKPSQSSGHMIIIPRGYYATTDYASYYLLPPSKEADDVCGRKISCSSVVIVVCPH